MTENTNKTYFNLDMHVVELPKCVKNLVIRVWLFEDGRRAVFPLSFATHYLYAIRKNKNNNNNNNNGGTK